MFVIKGNEYSSETFSALRENVHGKFTFCEHASCRPAFGSHLSRLTSLKSSFKNLQLYSLLVTRLWRLELSFSCDIFIGQNREFYTIQSASRRAQRPFSKDQHRHEFRMKRSWVTSGPKEKIPKQKQVNCYSTVFCDNYSIVTKSFRSQGID